MNTKIFELGDIELDAVSGGFGAIWLPVLAAKVVKGGKGDGPTTGQNDPAQQFQQIMQQLTGQQ